MPKQQAQRRHRRTDWGAVKRFYTSFGGPRPVRPSPARRRPDRAVFPAVLPLPPPEPARPRSSPKGTRRAAPPDPQPRIKALSIRQIEPGSTTPGTLHPFGRQRQHGPPLHCRPLPQAQAGRSVAAAVGDGQMCRCLPGARGYAQAAPAGAAWRARPFAARVLLPRHPPAAGAGTALRAGCRAANK